jgi:hypothetical protein
MTNTARVSLFEQLIRRKACLGCKHVAGRTCLLLGEGRDLAALWKDPMATCTGVRYGFLDRWADEADDVDQRTSGWSGEKRTQNQQDACMDVCRSCKHSARPFGYCDLLPACSRGPRYLTMLRTGNCPQAKWPTTTNQ